MKKTTLFLCLIFSINMSSQIDFRKGFIVNNLGVTIKGFVNYKENSSVFLVCEFKVTKNSKTIKYLSKDIKAFGYENDKYFISKPFDKENKFFEILVEGKATLYKHLNDYYLELDNVFKLLENNSRKYKRDSNKYLGILIVFFKNCQNIKEEIPKIKYTEKSLTKIVSKFNICVGSSNKVYRKKRKRFKANFGIATGINYARLNYNNSGVKVHNIEGPFNLDFYFIDKTSFSPSILLGAFAELSSPRLSLELSLYTGLFYLNYNYIENKITNNKIYEVSSKINQLKIPLGIRYSFPKKIITPFITLGANSYLNLNSETNWTSELNENNSVYITNRDFKTNSISFGVFGSIGIKKTISKKMVGFIDVIYENSFLKNQMINYISRKDYGTRRLEFKESAYTISSLQLLIGIQF
jgi:hypothetical protein